MLARLRFPVDQSRGRAYPEPGHPYRNAFQRHRCLILADAFFEWKTTPRGKQPMRVHLRTGKPFGMAGLYERWLSARAFLADELRWLHATIISRSESYQLAGLYELTCRL